jgi:hypothetical protein
LQGLYRRAEQSREASGLRWRCRGRRRYRRSWRWRRLWRGDRRCVRAERRGRFRSRAEHRGEAPGRRAWSRCRRFGGRRSDRRSWRRRWRRARTKRLAENPREVSTVRSRRRLHGRWFGRRGRRRRWQTGPDHYCRLHRDCCFQPVPQVHEIGQELRDDDWLTIHVEARDHGRAPGRQRAEQRCDASSLTLVRAAEFVHHHEATCRGHVREVTLHATRRDALSQFVFRVELVAGHRRCVVLRVA